MFAWRRNSIFRHRSPLARQGKKRKKYNKVQMGVRRERMGGGARCSIVLAVEAPGGAGTWDPFLSIFPECKKYLKCIYRKWGLDRVEWGILGG